MEKKRAQFELLICVLYFWECAGRGVQPGESGGMLSHQGDPESMRTVRLSLTAAVMMLPLFLSAAEQQFSQSQDGVFGHSQKRAEPCSFRQTAIATSVT